MISHTTSNKQNWQDQETSVFDREYESDRNARYDQPQSRRSFHEPVEQLDAEKHEACEPDIGCNQRAVGQ